MVTGALESPELRALFAAQAGALAQALGPGRAIAACGGCGIVTVVLLAGLGFRHRRITTSTHEAEEACLELASKRDE